MTADRIELRGIRAWGRHGANPGEQDVAQAFDIDVTLELDLRAARRSDLLADTYDYDALHRAMLDVVAHERFALLERLGEALLARIFHDERVLSAAVSIAKPGLLAGATPVVTVHRAR